jgi:hypothetical protein
MSATRKKWYLRRIRPRHYLLLQAVGSVSVAHFLISLSVDDESQYVHFRDPKTWSSQSWINETIHRRTPHDYSEKGSVENIAKVISDNNLPPLDIEFSFDTLFDDVGVFEDTDAQIPSLDDYRSHADDD